MSTQGIITALLMVIGTLISFSVVVVHMYYMSRHKTHDDRHDSHDGRIHELELNRVEEVVVREEILTILQRLDNVG